MMAKDGKKPEAESHAKEKLLLLLERALMALSYEDIVKLAPDHDQFIAKDIEWLKHVDALRQKRRQSSSVCQSPHSKHQQTTNNKQPNETNRKNIFKVNLR